jgi:ribA/ribD-fused uncharacterized protein
MQTMQAIKEFVGEFGFLSNFFHCPMTIDGRDYKTVEHYFQSRKAMSEKSAEAIRLAATPGQAKAMGQVTDLLPGWDQIKLGVMRKALEHKFAPGSRMAARLLETGNAHIEEGNYWGDRFWGVYKGHGQNHLGKLLMERRESLRNAATGQ